MSHNIGSRNGHPHMVTSLLHPKTICHKLFHKAYGLMTTATTSNTVASLDTIVWFTPIVPPLHANIIATGYEPHLQGDIKTDSIDIASSTGTALQ